MICCFIVLFEWKSWCLLLILLLTSVYVLICVHLSALLWNSSSSGRLFYVILSRVSRNLGVLRTFVTFAFHCSMCFFYVFYLYCLFFKGNPLTGLNTENVDWLKPFYFYIVQLEADFIFHCVFHLVHSTVLFLLFYPRQLFSLLFSFSQPGVLRILMIFTLIR